MLVVLQTRVGFVALGLCGGFAFLEFVFGCLVGVAWCWLLVLIVVCSLVICMLHCCLFRVGSMLFCVVGYCLLYLLVLGVVLVGWVGFAVCVVCRCDFAILWCCLWFMVACWLACAGSCVLLIAG